MRWLIFDQHPRTLPICRLLELSFAHALHDRFTLMGSSFLHQSRRRMGMCNVAGDGRSRTCRFALLVLTKITIPHKGPSNKFRLWWSIAVFPFSVSLLRQYFLHFSFFASYQGIGVWMEHHRKQFSSYRSEVLASAVSRPDGLWLGADNLELLRTSSCCFVPALFVRLWSW